MDCNNINLTEGNTGDNVLTVQKRLKQIGDYTGIIDGSYGNMTMAAVKSFQKKQGLVVDGEFGSITCNALNKYSDNIDNSSRFLTLENFKDMKTRTDKYIKEHVVNPKIVYIASNHYEYITYTKYLDVLTRYNEWIKKNGSEPNGVYINKATKTTTTIQTTTDKPTIRRLEKIFGVKITDINSLYNVFLKCVYGYYYNDIYPYLVALNRMEKGFPLNCTDFAQIMYISLKELGYTVRIVRGEVKCNTKHNGSNWFGHVWCQVYLNGVWVNIDGSAAAAHKYARGKLICTRGYKITNINPDWAMSDDGKT